MTTHECPLLPCADYVVLAPEAAISRVGSIVLAPSAEQPSRRATVAACGPDVEDAPPVGARVIYANWLTEVEIAGMRWRIVRIDDVLGVIA